VELQKVKEGEEDGDEKDALIGVWFGCLSFFGGGKTTKICQFFKKGSKNQVKKSERYIVVAN
jgi:hypothetical protein